MPISTHTPLVGRDINRALSKLSKLQFLLTRPSQGATNEYGGSLIPEDISTHTPLAGRDNFAPSIEGGVDISTHTPLAGRDRYI